MTFIRKNKLRDDNISVAESYLTTRNREADDDDISKLD